MYDGLRTLRSIGLPYTYRRSKGSYGYACGCYVGRNSYRTSGSLACELLYLNYYHYGQNAAGSYLI